MRKTLFIFLFIFLSTYFYGQRNDNLLYHYNAVLKIDSCYKGVTTDILPNPCVSFSDSVIENIVKNNVLENYRVQNELYKKSTGVCSGHENQILKTLGTNCHICHKVYPEIAFPWDWETEIYKMKKGETRVFYFNNAQITIKKQFDEKK